MLFVDVESSRNVFIVLSTANCLDNIELCYWYCYFLLTMAEGVDARDPAHPVPSDRFELQRYVASGPVQPEKGHRSRDGRTFKTSW